MKRIRSTRFCEKNKSPQKGNKSTRSIKTKCKIKVVNRVLTTKYVQGKVVKQKFKRKCYTPEAVNNAIQDVKNGLSLRKAGEKYGVPSATLCKKLKHPDSVVKKSGPGTVLTKEEEEEIIKWIIYRAETGSPVTKSELIDCVETYISKQKKETLFKNNRPGKKWLANFKQRHPEISCRVAQNLTLVRASVSEEDLRQWFDEVHKYLEKKDLINVDSSRVFNCDETNIQLHPKAEKVLVEKGARTVYKVIDAPERENATVLFMYSAKGTRAPPMLLFTYKELPARIIKNLPVGWGVGLSDSGWMNIETFYEYITRVFYPWLVENNIVFPIIIYLDGHASHVTLPLVKFCHEKQIELITLYPHSTHITQPLDIAFFHPLKDVYNKKAVPEWKKENDQRRLKKEDFPQVLHLALQLFSQEEKVIVNGFRAAGLYPFNPDNVEYDILKKKKRSDKKVPAELESEETNVNQSQNNFEDEEKHLKTLENNLSLSLLNVFKSCEADEQWLGSIEQEGLFKYWLSLKKKMSGSFIMENGDGLTVITEHRKNLPIIKSVEKCHIEPPREKDDIEKELDIGDTTLEEHSDLYGPLNLDILFDDQRQHILSPTQEQEPDSNIICPPSIDESAQLQEIDFDSFTEIPIVLDLTDKCTLKVPNVDVPIIINDDSPATKFDKDCLPIIVESSIQADVLDNDNTVCKVNVEPTLQSHIESQEEGNDANVLRDISNPTAERVEENTELGLSKEKIQESSDNRTNQQKENFDQSFTLPIKYLPKNKKKALAAKGQKKLPVVGTSQEWLAIQLEKEKQQKIKEEKAAMKKELQEKKKKLMDEKKKLQEEMKLIQKQIKEETV